MRGNELGNGAGIGIATMNRTGWADQSGARF